MEPLDWDQQLALVDDLIKKGKRVEVLSLILKLIEKSLPDEVRPKIARLANRSSYPQLALRILYKLVRGQRAGPKKISSEVNSVYAQSLLQIGALDESEKLMSEISDRPEIELQKALLCFARWDYQKALPFLKKYIKQNEISDYQKLVGRVNYLAALVTVGHLKKATVGLESLERLLVLQKASLLLGNVNELKSQIYIYQKKYDLAKKTILTSSELLKSFPGRYSLYTRKWKAVVDFLLQSDKAKLEADLQGIRKEALLSQNWETIRDCDFHSAFLLKKSSQISQIFWGTPHPGFRKRVRELYKIKAPRNRTMMLIPGHPDVRTQKIVLDFYDYRQMNLFSKKGIVLLQVLLKDIYKPPRIGEVFSSLYPNEYFDPFSSVQRVKNVVHRTNKMFQQFNIELQIRIIKGYFHLQPSEKVVGLNTCGVRFNQNHLFWPFERFQLGLLHDLVLSKSFCYQDLQARFENARAFQTIIQWGLKNKKISKVTNTRPIKYRFIQMRG